MSKKLQQIQAKARELALSGTFVGWRPIAFTLQFEEGFAEAFDWIYSYATQRKDSLPGREGTSSYSSLTRDTMASTPVGIRWQPANPMISDTTITTRQKAPHLLDREGGFRHSRWSYRCGQRGRVGSPGEKTDEQSTRGD